MEPEPISRIEHGVPGAEGIWRPGGPSHEESGTDLEVHVRPLEQVHAGVLHGSGVAAGLAVRAAPGTSAVRVLPGVAVDAAGRHVVLAAGGTAEVGDDPDLSSVLVPVPAEGVEVSTARRSGPCRITVQYRETFDQQTLDERGAFVTRHTPWLRVQPVAGDVAAGSLVLATVDLDAEGRVPAGGLTAEGRVGLALSTSALRLRATVAADPAGGNSGEVADVDAGALLARPGGGVELRSAGSSSGAPPLSVSSDGQVGIGTADPGFALDVADRVRLRQGRSLSAGMWLFQREPGADRAFVGMADDDRVGLFGSTGAGWGLLMNTTSGRVDVEGSLSVHRDLLLPNSSQGNVRFTGGTWPNESDFAPNNLKLVMAERFLLPPRGGMQFQFLVGYSTRRLSPTGMSSRFNRVFSVDHEGNAYFAGGKVGYVVDYFVNAVGEPVERGDVVVLSDGGPVASYVSHGDIPVPEVDLTDRPYDGRVCGIVADAVPAGDLPSVDPATLTDDDQSPLARFGAEEDTSRTMVADRRLGRMVTLGAWAHCKVDADLAPIEAGDLLTTSPTRGHAQKAEDRGRALGAVVGKALAPLAAGRGIIPVQVGLR